MRVRVRTWACVYTGAGGRRSHAALAFSRTAPSGAPSPLACSFTCPHPDISVPQSGLWQLAPPPRSSASHGLRARSPPGPTPYTQPPALGSPLSVTPALHGDTHVPLPPGSFFLARSVSHPSSRLIPHLLTGHMPHSGFLQDPPGAFKDQGDRARASGADGMSSRARVHPQASPGARHGPGARRTLSG